MNSQVAQATYSKGMNAGMKVRFEQATADTMKGVIANVLPTMIKLHEFLPDHLHERLNFFTFIGVDMTLDHLAYQIPSLDMSKVEFEMTDGYDTPLLKVKFPAIKAW